MEFLLIALFFGALVVLGSFLSGSLKQEPRHINRHTLITKPFRSSRFDGNRATRRQCEKRSAELIRLVKASSRICQTDANKVTSRLQPMDDAVKANIEQPRQITNAVENPNPTAVRRTMDTLGTSPYFSLTLDLP